MKNKWTIDTLHSDVQFKVKHLLISTATGTFGTYSAEVEQKETHSKQQRFTSVLMSTALQQEMISVMVI
jgi:polyisoprenoid-binding protein YceI